MFRNKKELYISFKNHVLRYGVIEEGRMEGFGELRLPSSVVDEGTIHDEGRFQRIVEEIVDEHGLKRSEAVIQLLDQHVLVRTVEIPEFVPEEEIKGYIYSQLGETIHLPYEDPVVDYARIEKSDFILLFAYPSFHVNQLEGSLKKAKLKVRAADVSFLSLYRCYEYGRVPEKDEHLLFVDWNLDGVSVTGYYKDIPRFSRFMKSDLPSDYWEVKENSGEVHFKAKEEEIDFVRDYIQEQISELDKLMNFYRYSVSKDQKPVTGIVLSGDFPEIEYVRNAAETQLRVSVEYIAGDVLENGVPFKYADVTGLSYRE
ncbi:type IV pilus biogenesis protein PilM [Salimicrobium flavidum]|uniref:Type IV pilus assembly protein PilM n=1 Tax=Salimicrobium flavidum TaxID=570947 RepID=A0A1N7JMN2_9BACI|nr:pilus assembly protein PilM [Salimicrobium flavidum]SIS50622.1 type IV pilus assembly protein PilM [Salimicrobium flavidum]